MCNVQVELGQNLPAPDFDGGLDSTDSAIYTVYNAEMKVLQQLLRDRPDWG